LSVKASGILAFKNYSKFAKENSFFVMAAADSLDTSCCTSEKLLEELMGQMESGKVVKFPVVRIDVSADSDEWRSLGLNLLRLPQLFIVKNRQIILYDGANHNLHMFL